MLNPYPYLSPVAFHIGNVEVRWYSLMYVIGLLFAHSFLRYGVKKDRLHLSENDVDIVMLSAFLGMFLGARLFYVVFYNPEYFFSNPADLLATWKGGLSFHGALVGIGLACFLFARIRRRNFLEIADHLCCAAPLGIALGRIGNFMNQELWGRETSMPWGVVFPNAGPVPRHPSQLYESLLEGWFLFALMMFLYHRKPEWKHGYLSAALVAGYGAMRFIVEFFREPDVQLGFVFGMLTMGQLLCLAMVAASFIIAAVARTKAATSRP